MPLRCATTASRWPLVALAASLAVAVVAGATPAHAVASPGVEESGALGPIGADTDLSEPVRALPVASDDFDRAVEAYEAALFELADTRRIVTRAERDLTAANDEARNRAIRLDDLRFDLRTVTAARDETNDDLRELALHRFTDPTSGAEELVAGIDADAYLRVQRRRELLAGATGEKLRLRRVLDAEVAEAEQAVTNEEVAITALEERRVGLTSLIETNRARAFELTGDLGPLEQDIAAARAGSVVRGSDIPVIALDAYVRAAAVIAEVNPNCAIHWSVLAGIGVVESNHGRFRGAAPDVHGDVKPEVYGLPLDGSEGVAFIGDSDGGAIDGTAAIDRAVGPMQFIPDTWRRHGLDGNGDGDINAHNLYDTAATAASYLCAVSGDLKSEPGLRRALLGYNRSIEYGDAVLANAAAYAAAVDVAGLA